jgi:hypothetical protein
MKPTKLVNGIPVELTDEEIAAREAEIAEEGASRLPLWRENATLTRRQFCLACLQAGLLSPEDAVVAAKGDWPVSFDAALVGLSEMEVAAAKVEWASVSTIRRNAPLLAVVQTTAGITDGELDALFGWQG